MELVRDTEVDPERPEETTWQVFEIKGQKLIYAGSSELYNCHPRRKDLFRGFVSERAFHFWRNGMKWNSLLNMFNYNATGEISSQHQCWASLVRIGSTIAERRDALPR